MDRGLVFRAALESVVLGDASRFEAWFTDDVMFTGPHLVVASRAAVQAELGVPEDSLSDVGIVVRSLDAAGDRLAAEWRLDATFSRALLFDDSLLVEPTGGRVELTGASVAEFRGTRICAFRHYFDDSELLDRVPGVPAHVRWTGTRRDAPSFAGSIPARVNRPGIAGSPIGGTSSTDGESLQGCTADAGPASLPTSWVRSRSLVGRHA